MRRRKQFVRDGARPLGAIYICKPRGKGRLNVLCVYSADSSNTMTWHQGRWRGTDFVDMCSTCSSYAQLKAGTCCFMFEVISSAQVSCLTCGSCGSCITRTRLPPLARQLRHLVSALVAQVRQNIDSKKCLYKKRKKERTHLLSAPLLPLRERERERERGGGGTGGICSDRNLGVSKPRHRSSQPQAVVTLQS